MNDDDELGATGRFPEGKLTEHDEGEIRFGVGTRDGHVFLSFKTPVACLAMPPERAIDLAEVLLRHAVALGSARPISIRIGGGEMEEGA